uniref:Major facilitator superfamily (MFS) profile domain-containing protein n=1 Tax=Guillardia theta TaxID=55529 RepID=A0A7S4KRF5_GUITH
MEVERERSKTTRLGWSKILTVTMICLLTACLFADQNLMAPNLTAISQEFSFTPQQRDEKLGGEVAFAFFLAGAPIALWIGWLADKMPRKWLFCGVVILGEGPALATLWVKSYHELLFLRALTGIAVGGALPLIFSMLGDMFENERRNVVSAIVSLSQGFGISIGQFISGVVGPQHGWRLPFAIVAVPSIVFTCLAALCMTEPQRGSSEAALRTRGPTQKQTVYTEKISMGKACGLFTIQTNLLVFLQGVTGCLPWAVIVTFLNDYLSQEKHFTIQSSTAILTAYNVGGMCGFLIGGLVGQIVYNRNSTYVGVLMASTTSLGIFPLMYLLNLPEDPPAVPVLCVIAFFGGVIACVTGANIRAVLLNVNAPETRGSAFAVYTLMDDLGKGFGPAAISGLIALSGGRQAAFNGAVLVGWSSCALLLLCICLTLRKDEQKLQQQIKLGQGATRCCFV